MGTKVALIYMCASHNNVETMHNNAIDQLSNTENN